MRIAGPTKRWLVAISRALLLHVLLASGFAANPPDRGNEFTAQLGGLVLDAEGKPQMGATVLLFNHYGRLLHRTVSDEHGIFTFPEIPPGIYSLKVLLSSYLPAVKENLEVRPGLRYLLSVTLASAFSSIELISSLTGNRPLMTEAWKWALRSSAETRPVLRLLPEKKTSSDSKGQLQARMHSLLPAQDLGIVRVQAGGDAALTPAGLLPDMATSFAMATTIYGTHQLAVSANVGYAGESGRPLTTLRTAFLPTANLGGADPEFAVTLRQAYLPVRAGTSLLANQAGAPALRSVSISYRNALELAEATHLDYGIELNSISFLERFNYLCSYARVRHELGSVAELQAAYYAGQPPSDAPDQGKVADEYLHLANTVRELNAIPRLSLKDGRPAIQRSQTVEVSLRRVKGEREFTVGWHYEQMNDPVLLATGDRKAFTAPQFLPSLFENTATLRGPQYTSSGLIVAASQLLGEKVRVQVAAGTEEGLKAEPAGSGEDTVKLAYPRVAEARRHWIGAAFGVVIPGAGTKVTTSYTWGDPTFVTPRHVYVTAPTHFGTGLNLFVRQPLPFRGFWGSRLEISADLQNLLSQGYVPVGENLNRPVYLIQVPKSIRGGVDIIF